VFVVAACGLVYELAAGALASYLLGDSVLQFSTVIGTYLFAMGLGSWLSRHVERDLVAQFLRIELAVGLIGGLLPAALFAAHSVLPAGAGASFRVLLYSQVLTFDYLGALMVAVAFPLLLVPQLGLVRTGVLFGLLNAAVAVWALWLFRAELLRWRSHALACAAVVATLVAALLGADALTSWAEDRFYGDGVIVRESSEYQRIVVTSGPTGMRLYLNGNLQFHSRDEYRYHEALVHPALAAQGAPRKVLVLGGGDGLAVREVLRHPGVERVVLVELDPHIVRLFRDRDLLAQLNDHALRSPKLTIVQADAFTWLDSNDEMFDAIVVDFPDPTNFSLGKLYTTSFYERVDRHLAAGGFAVVQTTSPLLARRSYWTVVSTIEAVGFTATPYHAHVPSFGEWGFVLMHRRPWAPPRALPPGLRFLTVEGLPALLQFPPDMARVSAQPNRLSNQVLVHTFEEEWGKAHQ
jgi:spermidine synthase